MYKIIEDDDPIIDSNNLFYEGDTSVIYKYNGDLYKIYLKKERHKREILDYLIENYDSLKDYSIPPLGKLKYHDTCGMRMHYVDAYDFHDYVRGKITNAEFIRILKILSENLKKLNALGIVPTDLHHHNVLIRKSDNYPLYIDLDDTNVNSLGSCHISRKSYDLHNIDKKGREFKDKIIKFGNLDRECLFLYFLDFLTNKALERLSYDEYNQYIDMFYDIFDKDFLNALKELKPKDDNNDIVKYPYYIGEFLDDEEKMSSCISKAKRRIYENSNI